MTDSAKIVIDGRELVHLHPMTLYMVQVGEIADGERRWTPERKPPNPYEWNWLGQARSGEHLYWMPLASGPSPDPSESTP